MLLMQETEIDLPVAALEIASFVVDKMWSDFTR